MKHFSPLVEKIPEPFTLSIILTTIAFLASSVVSDLSFLQLSNVWAEGLWSILGFAMQMVLCLSTGFALAQAPFIEKRLLQLCNLPKNYPQSVALVAFFSLLLGTLHWGLGLAGGSLLVREMNKNNQRRHFFGPVGLMAAAGYLPLMIWHSGLSGSAPLLVAEKNHFLVQEIGTLKLTQTLGHWSNLLLIASALVALPLICFFWAQKLAKQENGTETTSCPLSEQKHSDLLFPNSPLELRLPWLGTIIGLIGLIITVLWSKKLGFHQIGLNQLNAFFLFLAITCHLRLDSFLKAFQNGVMASASVILLFPFYGAIMALVKTSGLASVLSSTMVSSANSSTLPFLTFLSAGLLNIFVPSGGGQWVIQGPIAISAGQELGVSNDLVLMSVAYGDQLTNMLQPFWALPLLGLTGIAAKDLLRFTVPLMFVGGFLMIAALFLRSL